MNHRNRLNIGVILLVIMPVVCMVSSVGAQGLAGESIWTFDGEWPTKHIETADLNGDGTLDVIAGEHNNDYYGYPHQVVAADGKTGDTIWIYWLQDAVRSMTIGDVNNDGVMDVIAAASYHSSITPDGYVHAINGVTGVALWTFYIGATNQDVAVGDFNGDEYIDVAVGSFDDYVYAIDGETGVQLWRKEIDAMWVNAVATGDVNGDNIDDVAFAHEYLAGWDNRFGVINGATGQFIWDSTVAYVVLDAMIEDIDNDGVLEAIFAGIDAADQGHLYVRNAADGTLEWSYDFGPINHTNGEIDLYTYDLDSDTDLDLVIGNFLGWRKVIAFDGTVSSLMFESDSLESYPRDLAFADVTGDGDLNIVAATWDRISVVSAVDGSLVWYYGVSGTMYAVGVAEFDGDAIVDVAAGGGAEFIGSPPNPGKSIWALRSTQSPLLWEYAFGEYGNALTIADLNGDDCMDVLIVASLDDWVWAIDGCTGDTLWHWTGTENLYSVTTGDFDNNGQIDVAVAGNDDMVTALYGNDGTVMWQFTDPGDQIYRKNLQAADLNGDGDCDVIAGSDDGTIYVISGTTRLDLVWSRAFTGGDPEEIELAEMNGVPPIDVVAIVGGKMVVMDGADGSTLWEYAVGTQYAAHCEVMDANDDGVLDVAIGIRKMGATPGKVLMVDGNAPHDEMWSSGPMEPCSDYGFSHALLNWDKAADLIVGTNYNERIVYAFDGTNGAELWSFEAGDEINCVLGYDLDGDGQEDALVGSDDGLVRALDGATGEAYFEQSCAGDVMHLGVGDINGDGAGNLACVTFGSSGVVYAYSSLYDAGCCVDIAGNIDFDIDDQITIADLVYMVDFMFNAGPAPSCWEEAELAAPFGDEALSIADLVFLVDYMFNEGPPPPDCP